MSKLNWLGKVALVALACGQGLDVLSTNVALASSGQAQEANPAMKLAMWALGSYWWLPKLAIALTLLYFACTLQAFTKRQVVVLSVCFKAYVIVIISNLLHTI